MFVMFLPLCLISVVSNKQLCVCNWLKPSDIARNTEEVKIISGDGESNTIEVERKVICK